MLLASDSSYLRLPQMVARRNARFPRVRNQGRAFSNVSHCYRADTRRAGLVQQGVPALTKLLQEGRPGSCNLPHNRRTSASKHKRAHQLSMLEAVCWVLDVVFFS